MDKLSPTIHENEKRGVMNSFLGANRKSKAFISAAAVSAMLTLASCGDNKDNASNSQYSEGQTQNELADQGELSMADLNLPEIDPDTLQSAEGQAGAFESLGNSIAVNLAGALAEAEDTVQSQNSDRYSLVSIGSNESATALHLYEIPEQQVSADTSMVSITAIGPNASGEGSASVGVTMGLPSEFIDQSPTAQEFAEGLRSGEYSMDVTSIAIVEDSVAAADPTIIQLEGDALTIESGGNAEAATAKGMDAAVSLTSTTYGNLLSRV